MNTIRVTPQRVGKIRKAAKTLVCRAHRNRRLVPARELAAFVGLVQSCYLAVPVTAAGGAAILPRAMRCVDCGVLVEQEH